MMACAAKAPIHQYDTAVSIFHLGLGIAGIVLGLADMSQ